MFLFVKGHFSLTGDVCSSFGISDFPVVIFISQYEIFLYKPQA